MPFVRRDNAGNIIGRFTVPQAGESLEWLPDDSPELLPALADLKAVKNTEINSARLIANQSAFPFAGTTIASDPLSRSDIDGVASYVALNDALPPNWPGAWKAVDNSYVAVPDVATFKALIAAMVAQGNSNFAHSQNLKAALAAATTPEQVAAITW